MAHLLPAQLTAAGPALGEFFGLSAGLKTRPGSGSGRLGLAEGQGRLYEVAEQGMVSWVWT